MKKLMILIAAAALLAGCGSSHHGGSDAKLSAPRLYFAPGPGDDEATHVLAHGAAQGTSCGVERWAVKTLTDPNAGLVAVTPVYNASIAGINKRPAPQLPSSNSVRLPQSTTGYELHTFRVSGTVTFQRNEADSDIHLALSDGNGNSMIAESPDPACAQGSRVLSQISAVRAYIDSQGSLVGKHVVATGVGFFDFSHGQTGVARNAAELHPLLSIAVK